MFNLSQMGQLFRAIQTKLFNMIKKGYVTLPTKNSGTYSTMQVRYLNKTGNAFPIYPYGMMANPPVNNMCLLFNINAHEDNLAAICYTQKNNYGVTLENTEAILGNPESGSYIRFLENGDIEINAKNNIIVNGKKMDIVLTDKLDVQTTEMDIHGKVKLGDGGAAIARFGDQVTVAGNTGTITGGSANNTSN